MTVTDTEHSKSTNNYQITEQDEKSAPQYENETRVLTSMWKSMDCLC